MRNPLKHATPRRLVRRDGEWYLELERLVHLGEGVLRPMKEQLRGAAPILSWLETTPDMPGLAHAASSLFRSVEPANDVSFEAAGGSWIPALSLEAMPVPAAEAEAMGHAPTAALSTGGGASSTEVADLKTRVERLERQLMALATTIGVEI